MSTPLSLMTRGNQKVDSIVSDIAAMEETEENDQSQELDDLENNLKNYDRYQAIYNGCIACLSNETGRLAVLDQQGKIITDCKVSKRPDLEIMQKDKKAKTDTWSFSWIAPHFVKGNTYIVLESGGRCTSYDIYCFDEINKVIELFQQEVVEPKFYNESMLTRKSNKPDSYRKQASYELCNLPSKKCIQIHIPLGNLPTAAMEPGGIRFRDYYKQRTIAYYSYDGRNIINESL